MTEHGGTAASPVPREARAYQGHRAGMVTRSIAAAVDVLVVLLLTSLGYLALNAVSFVLDPRGYSLLRPSRLPVLSLALALTALYLAISWAALGRSYGCHVMGLRVIDRHGHSPRPLRALARAVLYVAFPVGLFWCAVSGSRRSLQDVVLGTSVIYDWTPGLHDTTPATD